MTTKEALIGFYKFNRLNLTKDFESHCVRVYIGCILAPVPNVSARKKYLKFHDLHHIIAGYGIGRVGESEISAWELGSRSCRKPIISIMNLFALSTGFILKPRRVINAFYRGCRSKNLYYLSSSMSENDIDNMDLNDVKKKHLEIKNKIDYKFLRQIEFIGYIIISMFIHVAMLFIGKSLLIAESIKLWIGRKISYNV
ncbi:MAG TPA: hypothetical protein VL443_26085 [Cyclobacteriaceae bacterium]|jgi:hypothetical protein|nr:hypothetical protein [Cyclobacteriaceae bacterium]